MPSTRPRIRLAPLVAAVSLLVAVAACSATGSTAERTVTIVHGPATPTGTVPGAADGVGTVRLFHQPATIAGGATGTFDATMVTTAVDQPEAGLETRLTTIVFSFADGADQLILEGTASYPSAGSTLKVADTVVRPVIGGSGAYAGARGWAASTHLPDGTWEHVFHLQP